LLCDILYGTKQHTTHLYKVCKSIAHNIVNCSSNALLLLLLSLSRQGS